MTKAEKMFNELNYTLITETEEKVVYRLINYFIEFDKRFEWVQCYEIHDLFHDEEVKLPMAISYPELQAINQQVKELGWNE